MRVFFEGTVPTHFTVYKLTLNPGENIIHDEKDAHALLAAHASDCKRSGDKPRIRRLEEKKAEPTKVVTSATLPKSADAKKGAK